MSVLIAACCLLPAAFRPIFMPQNCDNNVEQVSLMCANAASGIAEACTPDGNYKAMAFELVVTWAGAGVAVRGAVLQCT